MISKKFLLWVGITLLTLSLLLVGLSFLPGWSNRTDPAVIFLTLTVIFLFAQYVLPKALIWKAWLMLPTSTFFAFGLVFTFNALTNDWSAWAYAWMLPLAGFGAGMIYAIRAAPILPETTSITPWVYWVGVALLGGGAVFFAIFGAIAGGAFMRIFSLVTLGVIGILVVLWATNRIDLSKLKLEPPAGHFSPPAMVATTQPPAVTATAPNTSSADLLSKRELEVLHWIDQGLSNAEIAQRMVVANSTVKTHINNIFTKLDAQSRTQAVRRAKDLGLL